MGKCKKVLKRDYNGNVIEVFNSCSDAAKSINKEIYVVSRSIIKQKPINGFYYEYLVEEKVVDNSNKIKCPYCDKYFKTYNGLCKHVFKFNKHKGITQEQLLTDVKYAGIRPTCKCGCGGYTTIIYTGGIHFADYIQGHWNCVKNNWGHNPKAIENSSKTRREQYANGTRIQWNKGKTWDETYNKDTQEKLRNNLVNKLHERVENSGFKLSSQLEIDFIANFIKVHKRVYQTQYYIPEIKQFCDVYIPDLNLIIEVNGSYWHCDKRLYENGPTNKIQIDKIKKDEIKYNFLSKHNYNLLVIWEYDIINNKEIIEKLLNKIFSIEYKENIEKSKFILVDLEESIKFLNTNN